MLFHLTEDSTESRGFGTVPTVPTLTQAEVIADETFSFRYCSLAVAPDGAVYLQTMSQLWRIVHLSAAPAAVKKTSQVAAW